MTIGVEKMQRGLVDSATDKVCGEDLALHAGAHALMAEPAPHAPSWHQRRNFAMSAVKPQNPRALNPFAQYQKETTLEEVMHSRTYRGPNHALHVLPDE